MIYVERASHAPEALRSPRARTARSRATRFFGRAPKERLQELHEFDAAVYAADDVIGALRSVFNGKCAYCETPESEAAPLLVDHFRPLSGALDLDGSYSADHYWWLAYEWENLLPVCGECASSKGTRFPVEYERSAARQRGVELAAEGPQLLDPCGDLPELHLVYGEDGYVSSGTVQGRTTIEVLALNRTQLVEARAGALRESMEAWEQLRGQVEATGVFPLHLLDPAAPYSGIRGQFARTWLAQSTGTGVIDLSAVGGAPIVDEQQQELTREVFGKFVEEMKTFSVAPEASAPDPSYYITGRAISRIEIRNFKILRHLDLDFPEAKSARAPWLMLLGENGLGKSSVLQAVTLALMGNDYRTALGVDARTVISWGASEGSVTVHTTGTSEPIQLSFTKGSPEFFGTPLEPQLLLMAYGATRLLPRGITSLVSPIFGAIGSTRFANVDNLFNPFVALNEPRLWLMGLDEEQFGAVARGLKRLLPLKGIEQFERDTEGLHVRVFGRHLTLDQLSDGYQSVLGLATDMMQVLLHRWPAVEIAEGIVAIDELEAHLHPSWRMRIVASLRDVFPRLQFLTTTHDPLCLRGLDDGEVTVIRRNADNDIFALDDLPSVKGLRVDQLLTSEIFGLDSTSDPEIDELLDEYRDLRWERTPDPASRRRQEEVRARLDQLQVLGRNARERLVLEAADEYLAAQRNVADVGERRELKDATKRRIAAIFAEVQEQRRPKA